MSVFLAKHIERLVGVVTERLHFYRLKLGFFIRFMENTKLSFIQKYRNVFDRFLQKYANFIIFFFPLSYFPVFPYLCKFNFSEP